MGRGYSLLEAPLESVKYTQIKSTAAQKNVIKKFSDKHLRIVAPDFTRAVLENLLAKAKSLYNNSYLTKICTL